jgi:hypothetical protein
MNHFGGYFWIKQKTEVTERLKQVYPADTS